MEGGPCPCPPAAGQGMRELDGNAMPWRRGGVGKQQQPPPRRPARSKRQRGSDTTPASSASLQPFPQPASKRERGAHARPAPPLSGAVPPPPSAIAAATATATAAATVPIFDDFSEPGCADDTPAPPPPPPPLSDGDSLFRPLSAIKPPSEAPAAPPAAPAAADDEGGVSQQQQVTPPPAPARCRKRVWGSGGRASPRVAFEAAPTALVPAAAPSTPRKEPVRKRARGGGDAAAAAAAAAAVQRCLHFSPQAPSPPTHGTAPAPAAPPAESGVALGGPPPGDVAGFGFPDLPDLPEDDGVGDPPSDDDRILDDFLRAEAARRGAGAGLYGIPVGVLGAGLPSSSTPSTSTSTTSPPPLRFCKELQNPRQSTAAPWCLFDACRRAMGPEGITRREAEAICRRVASGSAGEIDARDMEGFTPLHYLCNAGGEGERRPASRAIAEALLRAGADANSISRVGATPLLSAVNHTHVAMCEILIRHGADLNDPRPAMTPLMCAAAWRSTPLVDLFLKHKADPNQRCHSHTGWTPLLLAVVAGHTEGCRAILSHGCDPRTAGADGVTPLIAAVCSGGRCGFSCEEVATPEPLGLDAGCGDEDHLPQPPPPAQRNGGGEDLLAGQQPPQGGSKEELLEVLLEAGAGCGVLHAMVAAQDPEGKTALMASLEAGEFGCAERLVVAGMDAGVSTELADSEGCTALLTAAAAGADSVVDLLLRQGASPVHRDAAGNTALHLACQRGDDVVAGQLCDAVAVDARTSPNRARETPLSLAVDKQHAAVVRVLQKGCGKDLAVSWDVPREAPGYIGPTPEDTLAKKRRLAPL